MVDVCDNREFAFLAVDISGREDPPLFSKQDSLFLLVSLSLASG
jgi:hypothetical protein